MLDVERDQRHTDERRAQILHVDAVVAALQRDVHLADRPAEAERAGSHDEARDRAADPDERARTGQRHDQQRPRLGQREPAGNGHEARNPDFRSPGGGERDRPVHRQRRIERMPVDRVRIHRRVHVLDVERDQRHTDERRRQILHVDAVVAALERDVHLADGPREAERARRHHEPGDRAADTDERARTRQRHDQQRPGLRQAEAPGEGDETRRRCLCSSRRRERHRPVHRSDESRLCQSIASGLTVASRCSTSKVIAGTPTSEPETSFTSTP